jgi:hypothetical protein
VKRSPFLLLLVASLFAAGAEAGPRTRVSIEGEQFFVNGRLTYEGRTWQGHRIEGLLFNSRMVQGLFDDLNPETRERFVYPDTGTWDPERNTDEFVAAMPSWAAHGMLAFTLNLQGGSPMGYGNKDWVNSAFDERGRLRPAYVARLQRILDRADELGMVVILGYFYFGQDQNLADEAAVLHATDVATSWILDNGYRNVVVEVANECNNDGYDQPLIMADRVHELMGRIKGNRRDGRRLLVGVSYNGNTLPTPNVVRESDYILIHGNGVKDPARITEMVEQVRAMGDYRPMPIVFNEDDHYDFEKDTNNLTAAVRAYASWGFFDFRRDGEGFDEGYQSVPVNWEISSERKKGFFEKVKEITGY